MRESPSTLKMSGVATLMAHPAQSGSSYPTVISMYSQSIYKPQLRSGPVASGTVRRQNKGSGGPGSLLSRTGGNRWMQVKWKTEGNEETASDSTNYVTLWS